MLLALAPFCETVDLERRKKRVFVLWTQKTTYYKVLTRTQKCEGVKQNTEAKKKQHSFDLKPLIPGGFSTAVGIYSSFFKCMCVKEDKWRQQTHNSATGSTFFFPFSCFANEEEKNETTNKKQLQKLSSEFTGYEHSFGSINWCSYSPHGI